MRRRDWPNVKPVFQEDGYSCVVACLAMVVGRPYDIVREEVGKNLCPRCGMSDKVMYAYLALYGYACSRISDRVASAARGTWPPKPFADLHIATVRISTFDVSLHAVVVDRNGKVFDPYLRDAVRLTHYDKIVDLIGITPI